MLDENLPTYRFKASSESPLNTIVYYTSQGSEPTAEYLVKRPPAASSQGQYALGLLDASYASVLYGEVLIKPQWTTPSLSAAEIRAHQGSSPPPVAHTPDAFTISLYNPDQPITVKLQQGSWGKSDYWEFEVPERAFRLPSASKVDQDSEAAQMSELVSRVVFRWKRDGRLSRDMTCYLSGKISGGKKSKEPDITIALCRNSKNESTVTLYEPNMARVEIEDQKGLEVILLLSAEVIRDLYLAPRQDPFHTASSGPPNAATVTNGRRPASSGGPTMAGAIQNATATTPQQPGSGPGSNPQESRRSREERERRDAEEQEQIRNMLNEEEEKERRRRQAEVDSETERLREQYGFDQPSGASPALPPRRPQSQFLQTPPPPFGGSGFGPPPPGGGGFGPPPQYNPAQQPPPQRPVSAGPYYQPGPRPPPGSHQQQQGGGSSSGGGGLGGFLQRLDFGKNDKVKKKKSNHV